MIFYSDVLFGKDAAEKMKAGITILSDAVASTLGPKGRNVAIAYVSQAGGIWKRHVVHDGVTVAKAISCQDEFMDMGASLLKQAAQKQVQDVGDGTTVSIILARAIYEELAQLIAAGVNPMELREGIEKASNLLIKEIKRSSIPLKTLEQTTHIATVSAEDKFLGELVAKVLWEMGKDGLVTVEESKNTDTTIEQQKGMQLEKGYMHPLFVTNPDRNEATLENPLVLVTDKHITTLEPLKKILEHCHQSGNKLVIIAPSMTQDPLAAMLQNKMTGAIYSLVIAAPSFGQNQKNTLEDIALYTKATYITEDAGFRFEDVTIDHLGQARYVTATKTETIIVGGKGNKKDIEERVEGIKKALTTEEVEFDREKMKERLAHLTSGVAVIRVGGITEVEMQERVERVKDAVAATKAALSHGVIPGGETIYLRIRHLLDQKDIAQSILYKALYKPFQKLLQNAGLNDGEWYERLHQADKHDGVNIITGKIVDMVKEGIIDPALVPTNALSNAVSVAIQLATTDTVVIQKAIEEKVR